MISDLLSLRALVVSPEHDLRSAFREAAVSLSVPTEILDANDAAAAGRLIADSDVVYLDGTLPAEQLNQVVVAARSRARSSARPPFTIHLATGAGAVPFAADALAGKPSRPEEAKWLLERSLRVRLPSNVLVVDDSSTMRSIVRKTLAATRFPLEVSEAGEGFAALNMVRGGDFQIVFLDYNMPDFNGLETLAEFNREQRRIGVVMMTSAETPELADRARALGAAFLKKPFFPADIETVLSGFYGLRALNAQRA
ncbi:MAG TPA: response regulator [Xanthobacteraceae bacterium]|jgi:CheY-like chemotaxis protein|nr:response regulator [Xanthobacteraceae bacterium]